MLTQCRSFCSDEPSPRRTEDEDIVCLRIWQPDSIIIAVPWRLFVVFWFCYFEVLKRCLAEWNVNETVSEIFTCLYNQKVWWNSRSLYFLLKCFFILNYKSFWTCSYVSTESKRSRSQWIHYHPPHVPVPWRVRNVTIWDVLRLTRP
jgi:hypothetical protein